MIRLSDPAALERLYAERGGEAYGEDVTQTEHALQCAALAQAAGAAPSLVAAALLHDVGHLLAGEGQPTQSETDDRHEVVGAQALKGLFGEAVRAPIALHVAAKRWLCLREPGYLDSLSPASRTSLVQQGGPFQSSGAEAFERRRYWRDAVALRRYDDEAKRAYRETGQFADHLPLLRSLLAQG